jgi:hypothetical protein
MISIVLLFAGLVLWGAKHEADRMKPQWDAEQKLEISKLELEAEKKRLEMNRLKNIDPNFPE